MLLDNIMLYYYLIRGQIFFGYLNNIIFVYPIFVLVVHVELLFFGWKWIRSDFSWYLFLCIVLHILFISSILLGVIDEMFPFFETTILNFSSTIFPSFLLLNYLPITPKYCSVSIQLVVTLWQVICVNFNSIIIIFLISWWILLGHF